MLITRLKWSKCPHPLRQMKDSQGIGNSHWSCDRMAPKKRKVLEMRKCAKFAIWPAWLMAASFRTKSNSKKSKGLTMPLSRCLSNYASCFINRMLMESWLTFNSNGQTGLAHHHWQRREIPRSRIPYQNLRRSTLARPSRWLKSGTLLHGTERATIKSELMTKSLQWASMMITMKLSWVLDSVHVQLEIAKSKNTAFREDTRSSVSALQILKTEWGWRI